MRLLLDECIDRRLSRSLSEHSVCTVSEMGWAGLKNGELLRLAEADFDAFVTVDRNLAFQQPVGRFKIAVLVLQTPSNRLADLQRLVPSLLAKLPEARPGVMTVVAS